MALLTEEVVRRMSNQGTRGPVVVNRDDVLTPSARSFLLEHRVEVVYPQGGGHKGDSGETEADSVPRGTLQYQTPIGRAHV